MWKAVTVAAVALVLLGAALFDLISPGVPEPDPSMAHAGAARQCLADIPAHFRPGYLSYRGHARAWLYGIAETLDLALGEKERAYLSDYSLLRQAVNCHIIASGDTRLNMTLSAAEFEAAYRQLAAGQGVAALP
jgi:hypothetical protein